MFVFKFIQFSGHGYGGNQFFYYDYETKQIVAAKYRLCLEGNKASHGLSFEKCDKRIDNQKWNFLDYFNEEMIKNWKNAGSFFNKEDFYID